PLLHDVVWRTRPHKSAEKDRQVWMCEGSPLAVHTIRQAQLLAEKTGAPVRYAMRYGQPSIASAYRDGDVVVPLYPQYAASTAESVIDRLPVSARVVREFHSHPAYIAALAANVKRYWQAHRRAPKLLMSFHGLPKRGSEIYAAQCHATGRLLARALGLGEDE